MNSYLRSPRSLGSRRAAPPPSGQARSRSRLFSASRAVARPPWCERTEALMTLANGSAGCRAHIESDADAAVLAAELERAREIFHPCAYATAHEVLALAAEPAAALAIEAVRGTVSQLPLLSTHLTRSAAAGNTSVPPVSLCADSI